MSTVTEAFKTALVKTFQKVQQPSTFISNFYRKELLEGVTVELQGQDIKSTYSVDTKLSTEGRRHDFSLHETKTYTVPEYNDYTDITENDIFKKQFGETQYTQALGKVIDIIKPRLEAFSAMQRRSEEKQAIEALLNGKIVLSDNSEIEFRKKASHDIDCSSNKWNVNANDPLEAIEAAGQTIINDGKVTSPELNLILETNGVKALLGNEKFIKNSSYNNKIERSSIKIPVEQSIGAYFHGVFAAGSLTFNLWGYNGSYEIPKGFNFANEGKIVTYMPKGRGLILPTENKFTRFYGSLGDVNFENADDFFKSLFNVLQQEQISFAYPILMNGTKRIQAGVKSRPLYVPVNIDSSVSLSGIVE